MSNEERLLKILRTPHVSEKATLAESFNQYVFKVVSDATKNEIKQAVKKLFNVDVKAVQTSNVKSKTKMFGRIKGKHKGWKKAYVALKEGQSINFGSAA